VINSRTLTKETRLHAQVSPIGIFGGHSGIGSGFTPSSSGILLSIHVYWYDQSHIWDINTSWKEETGLEEKQVLWNPPLLSPVFLDAFDMEYLVSILAQGHTLEAPYMQK